MVLFGQHPSQGTLLKASQFLSEELPIRLSHRVVELDSLPDGLNKMPSICKVKEWYAQSFEVRQPSPAQRPALTIAQELVTFPPPKLTPAIIEQLKVPAEQSVERTLRALADL